MSTAKKPRLVGMNHIALEVGSIDEALAFYGSIFDFSLRGRSDTMAFIDMGDQFIALAQHENPNPDEERHFGLVVDDRSAVVELALAAGAELIEGARMDFRDPWGNRIQMVDYPDIQFSKTPAVLQGMGLASLGKTEAAQAELADKGML